MNKVDYMNLLSMPEYAEKAAKDLAELAKIKDSKIVVEEETSTIDNPKFKTIDNPLPTWKTKGFKDKKELLDLAATKM